MKLTLTKDQIDAKLADLNQKIQQRAIYLQQQDPGLQALLGQQVAWQEVQKAIEP